MCLCRLPFHTLLVLAGREPLLCHASLLWALRQHEPLPLLLPLHQLLLPLLHQRQLQAVAGLPHLLGVVLVCQMSHQR